MATGSKYFFEFKKLDKPKLIIIKGNGYFDGNAGERLKTAVDRYLELGEIVFLFNFSGTPVINSNGLALLMQAIDEVTSRPHGEVHFCHLSPSLQDVFRMTGLTNLYPIHPTEEGALKIMQNGT